jgi:RHS repeat-associated protein
LSGTDGFRAEYDANGNMIVRVEAGVRYEQAWDAENRLRTVTNTVTSEVTQFTYDGDGGLARKDVRKAGVTVSGVYVGRYYEKDLSTQVETKHYYAGQQRIAVRVGNTLHYLYTDHLGSSRVSATGTTKQSSMQYDPYGTVRATTGQMPTGYRFAGERAVGEIGLVLMGARWYDPALARWVQPDTLVPDSQNPQALNRYSYSNNNPLRYVDPSGHTVISALDLIIQNQDTIQALAAKYQLNPLLLAGVVFAENRNDYNLIPDADWTSILAPLGIGGPEIKNWLAPLKSNPSLGITEISVAVAAMMDDPALIPANYGAMSWEDRNTYHSKVANELASDKRQSIIERLAKPAASLEYSAKYLQFLSSNRNYKGDIALQLADYNRGLSTWETLTPYAQRYVKYQKNIEHALNVDTSQIPRYTEANFGGYTRDMYGELP